MKKKILYICLPIVALMACCFIYFKPLEQYIYSLKKDNIHTSEYTLASAKGITLKDSIVSTAKSSNEEQQYLNLFDEVLQRVKYGYVEETNEKDLIESALNGMLSSLDPHSGYMTKEEYTEMETQTKGEFGGLGIEITMENSFVKVISPIEDTPAYKAGIKSGDYITEIDGNSVLNMSLTEAVALMRGKPGTKVKITVLRAGESEPLKFSISRDIIKIRAVRGHRENDIIYVKIISFTSKTYTDMIREFTKIENEIGKKNVKGAILDLRGNPGGLLDQAVAVSEAFLPKGSTIVSIKGRGGKEMKTYVAKSGNNLIPDIPMVVLINEGSASASEIVAGALQDNNRAIIMGVKSFGKGSVQSVMEVTGGGAVRMTIARYYTPSGRSIQAEGVDPDIIVQRGKLETIENKYTINEASLEGHLEKEDNKDKNNDLRKDLKNQVKDINKSLYDKDYQLARAVDLLLGISFYRK